MSVAQNFKLFERRKKRVRFQIKTRNLTNRPRLSIFRSGQHIYAQLIDDANSVTLVSASSMDKEIKSELKTGSNIDAAKKVGELIAKRAKESKIELMVVDKSGYKYHGRVKALVEAAAECGLKY